MLDKELGIEVHPAANIFPKIRGKAFDELVQDIRDNGLKEPVVFYQGMLLDGRNRYRACRAIGIEAEAAEIDDDESFDPVKWVLSMNLHRRHLGETEREAIAAKVATLKHGDVKSQKADSPNGPSKSITEAAEQLNVSTNNVKRAKAAIKGGCKKLVEALEAGEIPSSTAANFVKAVPDKKEQAKIFEEGLPSVRQAIKEAKIERDPIAKPPRKKLAVDSKSVVQDELYDLAVIRAFEHCDYRMNTLRMIFDSLQEHERQVVKSWLA